MLLKDYRDYLWSCVLVAVFNLPISCHQKLQDAVENFILKLQLSSCSFLVIFSVREDILKHSLYKYLGVGQQISQHQ